MRLDEPPLLLTPPASPSYAGTSASHARNALCRAPLRPHRLRYLAHAAEESQAHLVCAASARPFDLWSSSSLAMSLSCVDFDEDPTVFSSHSPPTSPAVRRGPPRIRDAGEPPSTIRGIRKRAWKLDSLACLAPRHIRWSTPPNDERDMILTA